MEILWFPALHLGGALRPSHSEVLPVSVELLKSLTSELSEVAAPNRSDVKSCCKFLSHFTRVYGEGAKYLYTVENIQQLISVAKYHEILPVENIQQLIYLWRILASRGLSKCPEIGDLCHITFPISLLKIRCPIVG